MVCGTGRHWAGMMMAVMALMAAAALGAAKRPTMPTTANMSETQLGDPPCCTVADDDQVNSMLKSCLVPSCHQGLMAPLSTSVYAQGPCSVRIRCFTMYTTIYYLSQLFTSVF